MHRDASYSSFTVLVRYWLILYVLAYCYNIPSTTPMKTNQTNSINNGMISGIVELNEWRLLELVCWWVMGRRPSAPAHSIPVNFINSLPFQPFCFINSFLKEKTSKRFIVFLFSLLFSYHFIKSKSTKANNSTKWISFLFYWRMNEMKWINNEKEMNECGWVVAGLALRLA